MPRTVKVIVKDVFWFNEHGLHSKKLCSRECSCSLSYTIIQKKTPSNRNFLFSSTGDYVIKKNALESVTVVATVSRFIPYLVDL